MTVFALGRLDIGNKLFNLGPGSQIAHDAGGLFSFERLSDLTREQLEPWCRAWPTLIDFDDVKAECAFHRCLAELPRLQFGRRAFNLCKGLPGR